MKYLLKWIAWILVIVGGLNWGLVGFFDLDLVSTIFGAGIISKIVYILVGLSAIVLIGFKMIKMQKMKK